MSPGPGTCLVEAAHNRDNGIHDLLLKYGTRDHGSAALLVSAQAVMSKLSKPARGPPHQPAQQQRSGGLSALISRFQVTLFFEFSDFSFSRFLFEDLILLMCSGADWGRGAAGRGELGEAGGPGPVLQPRERDCAACGGAGAAPRHRLPPAGGRGAAQPGQPRHRPAGERPGVPQIGGGHARDDGSAALLVSAQAVDNLVMSKLLALRAHKDTENGINKAGIAELVLGRGSSRQGRSSSASSLTYHSLCPSTPVMVNWHQAGGITAIRDQYLIDCAVLLNTKLRLSPKYQPMGLHAITKLDLSNNELVAVSDCLTNMQSLKFISLVHPRPLLQPAKSAASPALSRPALPPRVPVISGGGRGGEHSGGRGQPGGQRSKLIGITCILVCEIKKCFHSRK